MRNRSVRASGLGTKSFEGETGVEFAPRRTLGFDCTVGHHFGIVFAEEADMPATWDCPRCGEPATRSDGFSADAKDVKPVRTHWDMLRERRSIAELEELLAERLTLLRAGELGSTAFTRSARPSKKTA
jgi:hypothetical protein